MFQCLGLPLHVLPASQQPVNAANHLLLLPYFHRATLVTCDPQLLRRLPACAQSQRRTALTRSPCRPPRPQLYRFLVRRTDANFNKVILKRLFMSRVHRAPLSLSKLAKFMAGKEGKVAVLVATVTDDTRLFEVPKMRVCALRFTETARARIIKVRSASSARREGCAGAAARERAAVCAPCCRLLDGCIAVPCWAVGSIAALAYVLHGRRPLAVTLSVPCGTCMPAASSGKRCRLAFYRCSSCWPCADQHRLPAPSLY